MILSIIESIPIVYTMIVIYNTWRDKGLSVPIGRYTLLLRLMVFVITELSLGLVMLAIIKLGGAQ